MVFFVAILLGLLVYVLVKFVVSKVDSISSLAEILGVIAGILFAIWWAGGLGVR